MQYSLVIVRTNKLPFAIAGVAMHIKLYVRRTLPPSYGPGPSGRSWKRKRRSSVINSCVRETPENRPYCGFWDKQESQRFLAWPQGATSICRSMWATHLRYGSAPTLASPSPESYNRQVRPAKRGCFRSHTAS